MRVTYSSVVLHVPATPLGLLAERWMIDHWCNLCNQRVESDQLIIHAQGHDTVAGRHSSLPIDRSDHE